MLLSFAQFEREVTGERIRDKIAASKQKVMWMGGLPPLGYDVAARKLMVNEVEAETVRHVYRRYGELGSVRALKQEVDRTGVVSKRRVDRFDRETGGNPARWRSNLDATLPKPGRISEKGNFPALALDDTPAWFADLREREGMAARALEFLTMCAARSGEIRGATWDEIDLDTGLWTIPAGRMKAGKEHRVPLTAKAVALLRSLPRMQGADHVFYAPRGGALSDMSISAVMRRMNEAETKAGRKGWIDSRSKRPAVPHGIRSTFRDWAAERTEFPRDMAEISLAHNVGNEVERAYRRGGMVEKRRTMMAAWGRFLRGEAVAVVVDMQGALA
jgi:integrase